LQRAIISLRPFDNLLHILHESVYAQRLPINLPHSLERGTQIAQARFPERYQKQYLPVIELYFARECRGIASGSTRCQFLHSYSQYPTVTPLSVVRLPVSSCAIVFTYLRLLHTMKLTVRRVIASSRRRTFVSNIDILS